MKQTEKLDSLIVKIIKEELEEADTAFISSKDPKKAQKRKAAVTAGVSVIEDDPTDPSSEKLKTVGEAEEVLENELKASDIAGQVSEIVDKLKTMAEAKEDPRKQKLAVKAVKQMESAKAALEALTAHEVMLEEKDQEQQTKAAEKNRKNIERIFKGIVKDENIVNRLVAKLRNEDIVTLKKRLSTKGTELDEEKLARTMLNLSLKEGWVKKK
jgi:anion-transporting  ArsA/GET3 family ATPase